MSHMYFILSVAGWIWAAIVGVYLIVRLGRGEPRGFEVVEKHEDHS